MKKILLILLHFSFMGIAFGGPGGELIIKFLPSPPPPSGSYFNLSVNSNDYSWHMENNLLVLDNDFITLTANNKTVYSFGSPRTNIGHGDFRISWGLFTFTITTNAGYSRTFQLDLRDENWAEYYEDHDTYIFIDNTNNIFYISDNSAGIGGYYVTINSGSLYRIFSFWGRQPLQSNFKIPVELKNRIENGPSTDFGSLWANNHEVSSGISEDFRYFTTSNNAQHYTLETVYSNERKYSFKWLPNNVDAVINQNYYSANFSFTLPINNSPKDITRNFKTVWPLTIKNLLPEVGGTESFGEVYFKDPTTDNQFHNYPATNEGFVKNEAYENLEVDLGNGNLQRYSIKAVSTISYNGRNYYWYSGNFNPSTPTDLLITQPTTKTAKFKGSQISSQSDAYTTTSQRKFIKTPDGCLHSVYSSLNRVWYEMSSDNGVTWSLLNDGQPLDDSQGKLPSIDYVQLLTYPAELDCWVTIIVYQESYGSGFKIKAKSFLRIDDGPYIYRNFKELASYSTESYSNNANPVLAIDNAGYITFVWERKNSPAGLYCRRGTITVNTQFNDVLGLYDLYNSKKLGNINYSTSASSINPSITVSKTVYPGPNGSGRHLAWQENNEIKYATISVTNQQEGITLGTIETPSFLLAAVTRLTILQA